MPGVPPRSANPHPRPQVTFQDEDADYEYVDSAFVQARPSAAPECSHPLRPWRALLRDRLLLSRDGRSMWLNDQKVEIFFRAAFPLAFGLAVLVLFSEVW